MLPILNSFWGFVILPLLTLQYEDALQRLSYYQVGTWLAIFSVSSLEKLVLLCYPKNDLKWIGVEERDGSDVKTQIRELNNRFFV